MDKKKSYKKTILNIKEVSKYLDVHPATIYKQVRGGKMPGFKIGSDWRFHKNMIDKWILDKVAYNSQKK